MKVLKLPALFLAVALQVAPVLRVVYLNQPAPPPAFAIILKCLAGAAALLGTYHAVSAASAAIAGVSNTNPIGPVTTNAVGKVGQPFSYRIVVTNPGKDVSQNFWNAAPLPPGLTINTNIGGNGYITGTPTTAGVYYPVTLTAGNANSDIIVHLDIKITIQGTDTSPPTISVQPASQMAAAGASVTFGVQASGGSLSYQWLLNNSPISGANASSLTLSNVTTNQSGLYSVAVSNSFSSTNSAPAQLLVVPAPDPSMAPNVQLQTGSNGQITLSFTTLPGYGYVLQSSDAIPSGRWLQVTNVPPAFVGTTLNLTQDPTTSAQRYYRVQVQAN